MAPTVHALTSRDGLIALGFITAVNALGASPSLLVGSETDWIERPWFYPPEILFPVVWMILFTLMGLGLFLVYRHGNDRQDVRLAFVYFAIQFALNIAWTPIFFGLQRPDLGLIVIGALWVAILGTIRVFNRVDTVAAVILVPYLLWVSFAALLNFAIYVA